MTLFHGLGAGNSFISIYVFGVLESDNGIFSTPDTGGYTAMTHQTLICIEYVI
jgi:hypothetical protein